MNIAQEVFIDHEPSTITYEVGFRHNTKPGIMTMSFVCKIKEYCGFRCEKLTRVLIQCFLEGIALLARFEFSFETNKKKI